jgi:hypothetical protein
MMQQLFVGVPATTVAADGTATVALNSGWPASGWSKWNAVLTLQKGVVTVLAGSTVIAGPMPATNGGITFGPMLTVSSDQISIRVIAGQPGDTVGGSLRGGNSNDPDDLSSVLPLASSTQGSTQNDPSRLLSGQVGDPLVENVSQQIPNRNLNPNFVPWPTSGSFDIAGYGALLIVGDPNVTPAALPSLWMQIEWLDSQGNSVTLTQIDSLVPAFAFVVGAQAQRCVVTVFNQDNANHFLNGFSVIPLVQLPSNPSDILGNVSAVFGTFQTTPRKAIIAFQINVPPGTVVQNGAFIWPGRAIWSVGLQSGAGSANWNAKLSCFDAFGNETIIARLSNLIDPGLPHVQEVELTSGLAQVTYVNTAAAAVNMYTTLMAA